MNLIGNKITIYLSRLSNWNLNQIFRESGTDGYGGNWVTIRIFVVLWLVGLLLLIGERETSEVYVLFDCVDYF